MRTVCAALALLFAFSVVPAFAQQPSSELQQAQQDGNDAKLMLGNADIQNARLQHYVQMLQAQSAELQKQLKAADAKSKADDAKVADLQKQLKAAKVPAAPSAPAPAPAPKPAIAPAGSPAR